MHHMGWFDELRDFSLEVAKGKIDKHAFEFRVGYKSGVTGEEVICDPGGNHPFLTSAETLDIASDSVEDDEGGNGAQTLFIKGLDNDWVEQSESVTLDGTGTVVTEKSYLRFDKAYAVASANIDPVGGGNAGTISITTTDAEGLVGKMLPSYSETLNAIYSVPAGKSAYIIVVGMGAGKQQEAIIRAKARTAEGAPFSVVWKKVMYESAFWPIFPAPVRIPEKHDIIITAESVLGSINVDANFSFYLVDH